MPDFLTITQAAARLGLNRQTIKRQIWAGQITTFRVGSAHVIPAQEFKKIKVRPNHRPISVP